MRGQRYRLGLCHGARARPGNELGADAEFGRSDDRHERSAAAIARRQPGQSAALSPAGGSGAGGGRSIAAVRQIHGADPHRRDAGLWQPGRLWRRRHRLRFVQYPARQKKEEEGSAIPAAAACRRPGCAAAGDHFHAGSDLQSRRGAQTASLVGVDNSAADRDLSEEVGTADRRHAAAAAAAARPNAGEQSAGRSTSLRGRQPRRRRRRGTAAGILRLRHLC